MTRAFSTPPDSDGFLRPSPRMWRARQLNLAVIGVPVATAVLVPAWLLGSRVGVATSIVVALLLLAAWLVLRGRYRSWAYHERADDLLVRRGMLFRQLSVVPYGRMQFIDVTAGPLDRLFGLATVQLHTAAAASDARIPGLEQAEAERLRDRLASLGEAQATGL